MNLKYNNRDKTGKFAKMTCGNKGHVCTCGKAQTPAEIVAGRLYDWKGITVRAFGSMEGKRIISAHKELFGTVADSELKLASDAAVKDYLANV